MFKTVKSIYINNINIIQEREKNSSSINTKLIYLNP